MHRIIHTANSQYYLIDDTCVAVRGKADAKWSKSHSAVGANLIGSLKTASGYEVVIGQVAVAGRVVFSNDVMTSPVRSIEISAPIAA